jgi:lysophospholipase L1-like esterase
MKIVPFIFFTLLAATSLHAQDHPLKIAIVGDSTVANYKSTEVLRGWGQLLPEFFTKQTIIDNFAKNGRSSKTFIAEGLWTKALADKADIVLIQFGHNDSHTPQAQHPEATTANGDYMDYLRQYAKDARAAGATPVFVTPMHRRTFQPDGTMSQELLPYVQAMESVGKELNVPIVDIYTPSGDFFAKLGDANSAWMTPQDRTHFSEKGARVIAYFVAQGAAEADPRLAKAEVSPLPDPTKDIPAPATSSSPSPAPVKNSPDATMKTEVPN